MHSKISTLGVKKILVTWGLWFTWSSLINELFKNHKDKIDITVIDNISFSADKENIDSYIYDEENFHFIEWNVADKELMDKLMEDIDIVYYLASHCVVRMDIDNPHEFYKDEIDWVFHILNYIRDTKQDTKIVYPSTLQVYWEWLWKDLNEKSEYHPRNPYGWTKCAIEQALEFYNQTYKIDYMVFRLINIYGPRQDKEFTIAKFINQALNDQQITVFWQGLLEKWFLYIDDLTELYVDYVFNTDNFKEKIYNVGWIRNIKFIDLVKHILKYINKDESLISFVQSPPWIIQSVNLNYSLLTNDTWWVPKTDFYEWLELMIEYFKKKLWK